ncbi:beta-N-acetylglucosaminidase domain-containing protein [Candidatus Electrothrix sp.]|uniref:beta-N-acetylglucosaminidase domain-containing protein n=1 Tax=Candidatus Electrothrix sp. TaxID=2170559 RepID=UPI004056D020
MNSPYLGIIEGFFGRAWSFATRFDYAEFLKDNGYHFYIYAPKNDPWLRKKWEEDWPAEIFIQLQRLINHYQNLGLDFGIGLSPFEMYNNYDRSARKSLHEKITLFNELGINLLCVLFDDMHGDVPDLAQKQAEITLDVLNKTTADKVIMCPTYYSFDPVLEKVFGTRPKGYFQDLAKGLPPQIDIFWTGPKVCSQEFPESHVQEVSELLGRKPFLWDNYPVNDGRVTSQFILLKPFENRPGSLVELTAGHAANPMNQAWLSRIPLYSLPRSYAEKEHYDLQKTRQEAVQQVGEKRLAQQLLNDIDILHTQGLDHINPAQKKALIMQYSCYTSPYAQEIIDWLNGEYAFDPACLTD